MKVYLVFKYIAYEGDYLQGVFDSLDKANGKVVELANAYDRKFNTMATRENGTVVVSGDYFMFEVEIQEVQ